MATPSDPVARLADGVDRRLHPLSWLFIVLQQLKAFAVPLVLLLITGRGNRYELFGLVGVGGLAVAAVARYLTFRFRLGPDGVVMTSGLFQRTRRDIPYERIHDVAVRQSVLHRLFGVAEVRLESAGGAKSEGEMRVLALADAHAIETIIRQRRTPPGEGAAGVDSAPPTEASATLLALPPNEVVRLGLISNRGMVVVAAAIGALWQAVPDDWPRAVGRLVADRASRGNGGLPDWLVGPISLALLATALLIGLVVALRVLSVVLALLQFHGFTLAEVGRQLRVERGLLTRRRHHVPTARIQAWRVDESLLHRWFGRQSVRVDSAASPGEDNDPGTRDLIPLATPDRVTTLIQHLLPDRAWPPESWNRLHRHAWRRLIVKPSLLVLGATALATWRIGWPGLLGLVLLAVVVVRARLWATHAGYAEVSGELIAVREGWLHKTWRFAEITKLQTLRLTESPFDRRHGMATIWLDTAGASARESAFRIPYLPAADAQALHDRLAAGLDRDRT